MGTITVSVDEYFVEGNHQVRRGAITMSSSYATGGDSFTAGQFGFSSLVRLVLRPSQNRTAGQTSQAYDFAEMTNANMQGGVIQAFGDGGNNPGGVLIEAGNGTNLSSYKFGFWAWGY